MCREGRHILLLVFSSKTWNPWWFIDPRKCGCQILESDICHEKSFRHCAVSFVHQCHMLLQSGFLYIISLDKQGFFKISPNDTFSHWGTQSTQSSQQAVNEIEMPRLYNYISFFLMFLFWESRIPGLIFCHSAIMLCYYLAYDFLDKKNNNIQLWYVRDGWGPPFSTHGT